jgi:hypothetical protein
MIPNFAMQASIFTLLLSVAVLSFLRHSFITGVGCVIIVIICGVLLWVFGDITNAQACTFLKEIRDDPDHRHKVGSELTHSQSVALEGHRFSTAASAEAFGMYRPPRSSTVECKRSSSTASPSKSGELPAILSKTVTQLTSPASDPSDTTPLELHEMHRARSPSSAATGDFSV